MPGKSFYAQLGRLSAIVMILPASMVGGWVVGNYLIDSYFQTYPWGSLILTFLGAGAGFYEIYKILTLEQRKKP
jgi:F0F1-type ATP synthase assembly protein I